MMVALPNGTVVSLTFNLTIILLCVYHFTFMQLLQVHHINANNFLDQTSMKPEEDGPALSFSAGFEDPSTSTYIRFLQDGLEKAKPYLE